MMSQTDVKEIDDKAVLDVAVTPVSADIKFAGTLTGAGSTFAVAHYGSNNMITLRYRLEGPEGAGRREGVQAGRHHLPPAPSSSAAMRRANPVVRALGADGGRAAARRRCRCDLDLPRVAVFSTWAARRTSAGRYAFDKFELPVRPDLQGTRA